MVKMAHNNYNTTFCVSSKTRSKSSNKTIVVTVRLGHIIVLQHCKYQVVY